ncbi:MAG: aminoglycoside phosphotransferase family protein [Alphaproteobacteria bacterium]|nr:aminoglycoside phosphotransferase family protein [Alphaproteobacteria bacterium]
MSNPEKIHIDVTLVRRLIATQFPQWKHLPVQPVKIGGWDNRTFHLGDQMLVRLPSAEEYAMKVEKEQKWLPKLAPLLPLPIPTPLAMGEPNDSYPWHWSVYRWIEGETAAISPIANMCDFATSLAHFLTVLQHIDITDGPILNPESFSSIGALASYDTQTRQAISILQDKVDADVATEVWEAALKTTWQYSSVWVHGDISAGNLLVKQGKLSAVIDFGGLGVGDPACDLVIAWTFFRGPSRKTFRALLPLDEGTWAHGRAWALWKALIVAAGLTDTNTVEIAQSWRTIEEVLADYKCNLYFS